MANKVFKPRILIVDDIAVNLKLLSKLLSQFWVQIDAVESGAEAIQCIKAHDYALVLMDISMPNMDGFTATSKIRKIKQVPIIIITGHATSELDIKKGYESGCIDYFFKPVKPNILKNKVSIFLELFEQKQLIQNISDNLKAKNISLQKEIKHRIKITNDLQILSNIVEQSPSPIFITNKKGIIEYANQAFCTASGYTSIEIIGQSPAILKSGLTNPDTYKSLWETIIKGKVWRGEFQNKAKDGTLYWEHTIITPIFDKDSNITHFASIKHDTTLKRKYEEKLIEQAYYDPLTSLPNRKLFMERCEQTYNQSKRSHRKFAILYLDLDGFKKINDTFGHNAGDSVLIECAQRLQSQIRNLDTVARIGGDEFCILLTDIKKISDIEYISMRIVNAFRKPFLVTNQESIVTISIGISIFPENGKEVETLIGNADLAMYRSKKTGKNAYSFFTKAMNKNAKRRQNIEHALQYALEKNEFSVFYQPIVSTIDGSVISFEALLRWKNNNMGSITPDEFIPIAEHTGMILSLTEFVFNSSIPFISNLNKKFHLNLNLAINISPIVFRNEKRLKLIIKKIRKNKIFNLKNLELEITEGALLQDDPNTQKNIQFYKKSGIKLVMDDFGTGYSSLAYLNKFSFDVLKIDKSFIHSLHKDKKSKILVKAIIATAHGLGIGIVAEGIETKSQLSFLKKLNCDSCQGYLIAKPGNEKSTIKFLEKRISLSLDT